MAENNISFFARENETLTLTQTQTLQPANRVSISRKIAKRKSRASKRTPTTFINADPANFRRMVQEVTGVRVGDGGMPVEPARIVPEWFVPGRSLGQPPQICLPTFDSSGCGSFGPGSDSSFFDFDSLPASFPTLDSWGAM